MSENAGKSRQNDTDTQESLILRHLKAGKTLTSLNALRLFGSFRAAARVHRLRERGHKIHTRMVTLPSRKRIAVYELSR